jgi:hypothetical protein
MRGLVVAATFVLIVNVYASPAWAVEKATSRWDLPDRFSLNIGEFFIRRTDTDIAFKKSNAPLEIGVGIDFERNLGVSETESEARIDGYYRFNKRHRVDWTWFRIDRTGTQTIDIDIDLPDVDFPPGTTIETTFNTEIIKLAYTFSFLNSEKVEAGIGGGLHIARIDLTLEDVSTFNLQEQSGFTAPLPVGRFIFNYNITPRWKWINSLDFFFLEARGFKGSLTDFRTAVEHHTFRNVGFGFGLNRFSVDLETEDANADEIAEANITYDGLLVYVKVYGGMLK